MEPGILVPITLFGGTAVVLWKYFEGRHKERMAMIEKGINLADFKSVTPLPSMARKCAQQSQMGTSLCICWHRITCWRATSILLRIS